MAWISASLPALLYTKFPESGHCCHFAPHNSFLGEGEREGAGLCIVGYLAASLASTCAIPVSISHKEVSRHCHMPWWGQNQPWLRATALDGCTTPSSGPLPISSHLALGCSGHQLFTGALALRLWVHFSGTAGEPTPTLTSLKVQKEEETPVAQSGGLGLGLAWLL